jgi:hypothetical protein
MRFELRWSDIENAREAGRYPFRNGELEILARHIWAWEQDPGGVWEVVGFIGSHRPTCYGIRGFEPSPAFRARQAADPTLHIRRYKHIGRRGQQV